MQCRMAYRLVVGTETTMADCQVVEACMDDFHLQLSNMNERVSFLLGTIIRGIII